MSCQTTKVDEYELDTSGRYGPHPRWIGDKERISDYADSHPETLAGWWIEHVVQPRYGGRQAPPISAFVMAFTSDIGGHSQALRRLLFAPEKLQVVHMRYSYGHLMRVRDSIPSALGPAKEGLGTWGPEPRETLSGSRHSPTISRRSDAF